MQEVFERYGNVLRYPDEQLRHDLDALLEVLEVGRAREAFQQFQDKLALLRVEALEEHYTRAFDLGPQAVPYLSVHLFGPESPQRGQFMAALKGAYAEQMFDDQGELPDHLAVVLRYAGVAAADEWEELCRWCLPAPLRNMRLALEKAESVYQYLIASLEAFVAAVCVGEPSHA